MSFKLPQSIIYVTRDLERALGLPLDTKDYYIIANFSQFAKRLVGGQKNVLLIKSDRILDTRELLIHPQAKKFINGLSSRTSVEGSLNNRERDSLLGVPLVSASLRSGRNDNYKNILVFKPTTQIEKICKDNNWNLLNPAAEIANQVEEKISQVKWLGPLKKYLPPHKILLCSQVKFSGESFILQFNRAHTGSGTILIESKKQLIEIQKKFPNREVRITKFVSGPAFTNNNIVWGKKVLLGNISYQITGLKPFTNLPFATVGNDWELPHKILSAKQIKEYQKMATDIGERLVKSGWKGLFGIDVIMNENTGKLYLIEINARQPASTSYESDLQGKRNKEKGINKKDSLLLTPYSLSVFQAHLLSLLGERYKNEKIISIKTGAQIVQKIVLVEKVIDQKLLNYNIQKFQTEGWGVYLYDNKEIEKDWIRLQSKEGIMFKHNITNKNGELATFFALTAVQVKKWNAVRSGAIVIKDDFILLFKRHRFGHDFYCLLGGTVETGESIKTAAKREVEEETGLIVKLDNQKPIVVSPSGRPEYYYFCSAVKGEAKLGGEELERHSPDNSYILEWIPLKKLAKTNLLPIELKNILIKKYNLL
ncbi:MAG: NUDIX hydrolase [Candidatus Magasanikbacteria bacterium GW2011_GWA2_37_8]|uniref:NUDIX hydrolase n=1 Tax=Candidatus Magasanikbacteria bacterium GW2011_GWA2_37_8 TaxID=1619036 RepID=A0A0G0KFU1_9BACT|nr:MAG: NUDIX hydrolase [Candidatus Magasanikbacteria bacterium GW2011_GWA2_37_8]